jgi:hypothetical protein
MADALYLIRFGTSLNHNDTYILIVFHLNSSLRFVFAMQFTII